MVPQKTPTREITAVAALFALFAAAMFATYWRLPAAELYHTSVEGARGAAGRVLVFSNFPTALAAIGVLLIVADRLQGRLERIAAAAAIVLCAVTAWPGVVDEKDLDAKWSNVPAAAGVLLVTVLTTRAFRRFGPTGEPSPSRAGDRARIAVAALVVFGGIPYIAAELGFFLDGVPILGSIFITGAIRPEPGAGHLARAVHHGHHHGADGLLLALTALLLTRGLDRIRGDRLRAVAGAYLSLMLVYGLANEAEDLWIEQITKRGWTDWHIPNVLHPALSPAWLAMLAVAAVFYAAFFRRRGLLARRLA